MHGPLKSGSYVEARGETRVTVSHGGVIGVIEEFGARDLYGKRAGLCRRDNRANGAWTPRLQIAEGARVCEMPGHAT